MNDRPDTMAATPGRSWLGWIAVLFLLHLVMRIVVAWTFPLYYPETQPWDRSCEPMLGLPDHCPLDAAALDVCRWIWPSEPILMARGLAILAGSASLWLIAGLAYLLTDDRRCAFIAFLIALGLPGLAAHGVLWVAGTPLLLLHLAGLSCFWLALQSNRLLYWLLTGVFLGLALLTQLSVLLALLACAVYLVITPDHRRRLTCPGPWLGILVALVIWSPFLWLNFQDGWPAFRIQSLLGANWGEWAGPRWDKLAETLAEQVPNGSFVLAALIAVLYFPQQQLPQKWRCGYRFLVLQALAFLAGTLAASPFLETHPTWTVPAYPCAAICAALVWQTSPRWLGVRGLPLGVSVSIAVLLVGGLLLPAALAGLLSEPYQPTQSPLHAKIAKIQETFLGWADLQRRIDEESQAWPGQTPPALLTLSPLNRGMIGYACRRPVFDLTPLLQNHRPTSHYWEMCRQRLKAGGLVFAEDQGIQPACEMLYEKVTPLGSVPVTQGPHTIRNYALYRVADLRPGTMERLRELPSGVWINLLRRHSLDTVEIRRAENPGMLHLACHGWMSALQGPGTTRIELRGANRVLLMSTASLPRPDVAKAWVQSRGEMGNPHPNCGFTLAGDVPNDVARLDLVAHTDLGERMLMRLRKEKANGTDSERFRIECPAIAWSGSVAPDGPWVYPGLKTAGKKR